MPVQTVAQHPGVPLCGRATVWWCSITFIFPFQPLFKLTKISLIFMRTPALKKWLTELLFGAQQSGCNN